MTGIEARLSGSEATYIAIAPTEGPNNFLRISEMYICFLERGSKREIYAILFVVIWGNKLLKRDSNPQLSTNGLMC